MRKMLSFVAVFVLSVAVLLPQQADATRYWHKKKAEQKSKNDKKPPVKNGKEKPFAKTIKDYEKIEGLFDFYRDTTENKVLMAVRPDQFDKLYLVSLTRAAGDGTYFDAGAQAGAFPLKLHRVGKQIQFLVVNLLYRVDSTSSLAGAMERSISHSIYGTAKVESLPDSSGTILVDPTEILVSDVPNVGHFLGQLRKTGLRFDSKNSYFGAIKSFPENSEIDVKLHYSTNKPIQSNTTGSPYSMFLTYHYSISTLPETGYQPRLADDRVGYFMTQYQDYTDLTMESPYVRFINRWQLEKQDPSATVSEPVEPIVYWVENTVPEEYRDLVAQGIEWWQPAFERIGFKNAIIAKQMPDTADWDPADVRYNVVRWVVRPGSAYAVGPSRANPFTGQIYDADIRIMADFIRSMYNYAERYIEPLGNSLVPEADALEHEPALIESGFGQKQPVDSFQREAAAQAAEALALVSARISLSDRPELTQKFIKQYIVELVAHEVGHTLGLRHNFKASTIYSREERCDPAFTAKNGVHGSIMEYAAPNLAPDGFTQADFFMVVPGTYDNWAIEYGYTPIDAGNYWSERKELDEIAARSASDPHLVYLTDEDCFGNSSRAIDPYATLWDLGSDPFEYWSDRIDMSRELWSKVESLFETEGANYKKLRTVFQYGWGGFNSGAAHMARFIGGIESSRQHAGSGQLPFEPIPAAQQREAMKFLREQIWASGTFEFSAELVNKLQPERLPDFNWSVYDMQRIDYPMHAQINYTQARPLRHIYNPITLARISDIALHYGEGEDVYAMAEVFQDVRRAIWTPEVVAATNISGPRRNLQRTHLNTIINLVTNRKVVAPEDARTLARVDLRTLKGAISKSLQNGNLNIITRGHLEESLARINAALTASLDYRI